MCTTEHSPVGHTPIQTIPTCTRPVTKSTTWHCNLTIEESTYKQYTNDKCEDKFIFYKVPAYDHLLVNESPSIIISPSSYVYRKSVKSLRYQRVTSFETQVGNTNQRNKWANTDPRTYRRWDQVPRRSTHPPSIGHTHRELHFKSQNQYQNSVYPYQVNRTIRSQNQCSDWV
jgi:hypothetical protein